MAAKMKKSLWKRRLKIASVVLVLLAYGLGQLYMRIDKLGTDDNMYAADIAVGVLSKENGYTYTYADVPIDGPNERTVCDGNEGKPTPSSLCIGLGRDGDWRGCSLWRFERCTAYEASSYVLSRPELLGPMLTALRNPCRYLLSPEAVENLPVKRKPTHLSRAYTYFDCEDSHGRYPERLIINFVTDSGDVVSRYDIAPEKGVWETVQAALWGEAI